MKRIRSLVNAEFISSKDGKESLVQIGSGTVFEANLVEIYPEDDAGDMYANIHLKDGSVLEGVLWGQKYFENQGVPETKIELDVVETEEFNIQEEPEDELE